MKVEIVTLFPEMFKSVLECSILKRAIDDGHLTVSFSCIKDFPLSSYGQVDDTPYGGGAGMVLRPEPLFSSIERSKEKLKKAKVVFLTPQGKTLTHEKSMEFSKEEEIILLTGHYKGIDQRVRDNLVDEEISIGDYVLTGGELPAMVFIDSVTRLIPKVLGNIESAMDDSFAKKLLGYPVYTKPEEYRGFKVPDVLLSGHHENIRKWKKEKSIEITKKVRPDLLK